MIRKRDHILCPNVNCRPFGYRTFWVEIVIPGNETSERKSGFRFLYRKLIPTVAWEATQLRERINPSHTLECMFEHWSFDVWTIPPMYVMDGAEHTSDVCNGWCRTGLPKSVLRYLLFKESNFFSGILAC